jgi:hypothetical protein
VGWIRIDRITWAERALWVALVAAAIAPVALMPSAEEVARAYIAALNRGDVDAAIELTSPETVLRPMLGGGFYRGSEIRPVLEWRAALDERWRVVWWRPDSERREVHAMMEVSNRAWLLAGRRPTVRSIFVVRQGRIRLHSTLGGGSKELRSALRPFLQWVFEERPEELGSIWRQGHLVLSAEAAGDLVRLLEEWRAAEPGVAERPARGQG